MDNEENSRSGIVSVIAFCGFWLLLVLTLPWWSPAAVTSLESLRIWLALSPYAHPRLDTQSKPAPSTWPDAAIQAALLQCIHAVAPIEADLSPTTSIREGECGTPAPILVNSINAHGKVTFDPPLLLNCPMVAALHRWLNDAVQPAALEAFRSPVARIIGSSYACRTVYNEPHGRLSQHAFANAVDLPIFLLADGRKIDVAQGWGLTKRDLLAAAKIAGVAKGISSQPKIGSKKITSTDLVNVSTGETMTDAKQAGSSDPVSSAEAKFLRLALQGACKSFATVLGPEFNDVHRTHFHLDLQDRSSANVCK